MKLAKQATWLLPGLSIKRWIGLSAIGILCLLFGVAMLLNLHPVAQAILLFETLAQQVSTPLVGSLLLFLGVLLMYFGSQKTYVTVFEAITPDARNADLLESLYRRHKLDRGPRVVAIGGGTGLSTLLRGLKHYTNNLTAVVTVGDDGGSSGRLREEQGIIPPGDIRNCIAALADEEQLLTSLFQYRFKVGQGLEGHSFGNLFLTAMCRITGDMVSAIQASSKVLNIRGKVLPSSLDNLCLIAEMDDGSEVRGESRIPEAQGRIVRLRCEPAEPTVLPDVLSEIERADLIILGPGSLYTSVIPNLLMTPIAQAVARSHAPKIYVANMMTQPGETDGYSVADHVQAIVDHGRVPGLVDAVMVNNRLPEELVAFYRAHNCEPVVLDRDRLAVMDVQVVEKQLVDDGETRSVRHQPKRLARSIIQWYKQASHKRQAADPDTAVEALPPTAIAPLATTSPERPVSEV